ncbi:hypothetical protein GCM10007301_37580 [Azorhizobium oxalatiphilum]|uniref:Uncharacterized protein n=1 Tax=Azorhizobium oxalatiphilum TaxID=980631 RepID=A0A917C6D7_9HYPH|nr:hypothetical protein [Azorhizobium oxalatiphilum]GGF74257.1 hypothetical protein GCM10007301_37580 [Azorhizobium oxalatiphilum]
MMAFSLDVALLLVAAFGLGGALAYVLRVRARRRGLEHLARATFSAIDTSDEAEPRKRPVPSAPSPTLTPAMPPVEHVPLAPDDPELPLGLPPDPPRRAKAPPKAVPEKSAPEKTASARSAPKTPPRAAPVSPATPAAKAPDKGAAAETPAGEGAPGIAPPLLAAPDGPADDLKRLKGIGPQNERKLNALGIHHFRQIAAWTPAEVRWVGAALAFPGRIEREGWVAQARSLLADGQGPEGAGERGGDGGE